MCEEVGAGDVSLMTSGLASEWAWLGEIDVFLLYIDRAKLRLLMYSAYRE
jgi:hypothetical protein